MFKLPFGWVPVYISGPKNTNQLAEVARFRIEVVTQILHCLQLPDRFATVFMPKNILAFKILAERERKDRHDREEDRQD